MDHSWDVQVRTAKNLRNPIPYTLWMQTYGAAVAGGLLVLLFMVSGIVSYNSIQTVHSQDQTVFSIRMSMVVIGDVYTNVNGAQADAYTYVVNGNEGELTQYDDARQQLDSDLARLKTLTQGSAEQQHRVIALQQLIPSGLRGLDSAIQLRHAGNASAALQLIVQGAAVKILDSSRSVIDQMIQTENRLLARATTQAAAAVRASTLIVLLVVLSDLILLAIIFVLVRRTIRLREQLAEERARDRAQTELEVLQETNRRMDEFIGIAGHEFRTPLTTLKANLQMAARRLRRTRVQSNGTPSREPIPPAELVPLIDRASSSTERLERLTNDLLDMSRIKAGELVLRPVPLDLGLLVSDCVLEQQLVNPSRVITLEIPDQPAAVVADADRIRQAMTNYVSNALKFSSEDKSVHVVLAREEQFARVSVKDQGPGIPEDELDEVWKQFYRAPEVTHRSGSNIGLGLGLYISKTIITQHGGEVGVASAQGEGATFWFTLPLASGGQLTNFTQGAVPREAPVHEY
jgi:signal transduction histidine kinase